MFGALLQRKIKSEILTYDPKSMPMERGYGLNKSLKTASPQRYTILKYPLKQWTKTHTITHPSGTWREYSQL